MNACLESIHIVFLGSILVSKALILFCKRIDQSLQGPHVMNYMRVQVIDALHVPKYNARVDQFPALGLRIAGSEDKNAQSCITTL